MGFEDIATKEDLKAFESRMVALLKSTMSSSIKKTETYMTLKEAALYIKKRPQHLGEIVRAGEISYIRDGRLIKFDIKDLDNYMRSHRIMSDDEAASAAAAR